ncbi:MAG: hypothetical protein C0391_06640 [Anaerolinea sp.]|nr:hypothetical protein [Anaerolinea sp.]
MDIAFPPTTISQQTKRVFMISSNILGILLSLFSAASWGSGNFLGGFTTRKFNRYAVLVISSFAGIAIILICLILWPEPFPGFPEALWAILAGTCGVVGLGTLYKALSLGHSALVAPTAAVIGAAIPVLYGILLQGMPDGKIFAGFLLAFAGIWLVSRIPGESKQVSSRSLGLAIISGIGFGGFFIIITMSVPELIFSPLILSRFSFCIVSYLLLILMRGNLQGAFTSPIIWFTGFFDAGGTTFYMLAKQLTRVDVAVVLSSLYPAITILLSRIFLKEHVSTSQWLGVGLILLAVALISI